MRKASLTRTLITALAILPFGTALAEEAQVTLHSTVSGNREQPRVMHIVPWQQPGAPQYETALHKSIAEDMYAPLDRDEFVRGLVLNNIRKSDSAQVAQQSALLAKTNTNTSTDSK